MRLFRHILPQYRFKSSWSFTSRHPTLNYVCVRWKCAQRSPNCNQEISVIYQMRSHCQSPTYEQTRNGTVVHKHVFFSTNSWDCLYCENNEELIVSVDVDDTNQRPDIRPLYRLNCTRITRVAIFVLNHESHKKVKYPRPISLLNAYRISSRYAVIVCFLGRLNFTFYDVLC